MVSAMESNQLINLFCFAIVSALYISASEVGDGQVRLVGPDRCVGRVEVFYQSRWGTVCDDDWDLVNAEVVCRELNCGTAVRTLPIVHRGGRSSIIWGGVTCSGRENSLSECRHRGVGRRDCEHDEHAGVLCKGVPIRVVGPTRCSGRVEVSFKNTWGTVSDEGWDLKDAEVVCRELDCGTALSVANSARFGEGTGQIWLSNVNCSGTEKSLVVCEHQRPETQDFQHKDANVICSDGPPPPSLGLVSPYGGLVWTPEGAELPRGHSFVFTCSMEPISSTGWFILLSNGVEVTNTQPGGDSSASFHFPVAEYKHQGIYSCVYEARVFSGNFTFPAAASINVIITYPTAFIIRYTVVLSGMLFINAVIYASCKVTRKQRSVPEKRTEVDYEELAVGIRDLEEDL